MTPLTLDDLLPLQEYAGRRREFLASHRRYVDRYRRVRIGPQVTLIFENRQTLWFRVQEILRVARLGDPERVQEELDLYNRLLPGRDCLQAALLIDSPEEKTAGPAWETLQDELLRLCLGGKTYASHLVTCRPEDRCLGAAHWVEFALDAAGKQLLADARKPAYFELCSSHYSHRSAPLQEDVRQSLVDDLATSNRNASAA
jgi:hypothetical protein